MSRRTPNDHRSETRSDEHTELELEVSNVAHGGIFVARQDGPVVFVSDALPDERVRARVTETKKRFWRAETIEVLRASPNRQEHVWGSASLDQPPEHRVGGAEFGHIQLAYQRELKGHVIAESLQRIAKVTLSPTVEAVPGDDENAGLGWRTRVRLHVAPDGSVGPYAARSHTVIPVTDLPLACQQVAAAAPLGARFNHASSIDIVAPSDGTALVLVNPNGGGRTGKSEAHPIVEKVGERKFHLDARGFWQVHRRAAETLTGAVHEIVDDALFDPLAANLDLYGGVGLLAAAIGDRFGRTIKITSVESYEAATDAAAHNLTDWVGASVVHARVENYLAHSATRASARERGRHKAATVVLDPPRSGAGKAVVDELLAMGPAQIIYVACDPVAFARDVALFAEGGYTLDEVRAFDLFPHTHHVEVVGRFTR